MLDRAFHKAAELQGKLECMTYQGRGALVNTLFFWLGP